MAENSGEDCQEVGGGVELTRGTNTPGVEELPRGEETSGLTLEGDGVTGVERQEWGGERKPPATQDTEESSNTS